MCDMSASDVISVGKPLTLNYVECYLCAMCLLQMLYLASALIKFLWNTAYSRIAAVQVNQQFPGGLGDNVHMSTGREQELVQKLKNNTDNITK